MSFVMLKPGRERRLMTGHPWVYAGEINTMTGSPVDGDMVGIRDHKNRQLGVGLLNQKSQIAVRRFSTDAAQEIMSADLRHLYLGHLSRECNRPELAQRVMAERLQQIGATHVRLELTSQAVPSPTLSL